MGVWMSDREQPVEVGSRDGILGCHVLQPLLSYVVCSDALFDPYEDSR